jgi:two-component system, chemotaxis family, sensor kinase CheA
MATRGLAQDPYKYFRPEARDLVDQFAKGILALEKDGSNAAVVQQLLRLAHTLKGAARVVKQAEIADRAHAIEDTLSPFRESAVGIAREHIDTILEHLDEIGSRIGALTPIGALMPTENAEAPVARKSEPAESSRTVRTDIAEADAVLEGVAETHALLNGLRGASQEIEQARHLADRLLATADPGRQSAGNASQRFAIADELRRRFGSVERNLTSTIDQMDRELRQLREAAERLRLVSAANLFTALERTARDTARALSKQVIFEGKGGDIRLDSHVLETVQGALIQIIRNAVAHGIELEAERTLAGKSSAGHVWVNIFRRGPRIVLQCRDDGRGVDLEAVRRVASQRGLIGPTAKALDAEALVRMLLRGGISTSKTVTDLSGRGIGLDVVREAAERLGGEVVFRTEAGVGTTFELVIPPSLASMEALIVEAGEAGNATAIPLDSVRSTLRVAADEISRASPGSSILYEQKAIAFISLSTALAGTRWSVGRSWTAIVVAGTQGLVAIGVDRLLGTARIVVRPLPPRMTASPVVVGASLDADGNPQLVLDPDGLVAAANRGDAGEVDLAPPRHLVLVVDDSLTTRMLEQSILESAGYEVDVALSGEDALGLVRGKRYALILVDVEMPGMDGFTFIEHLRADPASRDIPAILVTSRAAPEDRQRGREVGAQGYIVKSEFDQAELLTIIRPLME